MRLNIFDKVYIKEDKDKRGRKNRRNSRYLKKGCQMGAISKSDIIIEL